MGSRQLRAFWPVLTAQPFVGATAAMLLFAVLTSGLIQVANLDVNSLTWQHHTVFGFLAGFSEPFFLGVVKRVAGLADEKKTPPNAPAPPKQAATPECPQWQSLTCSRRASLQPGRGASRARPRAPGRFRTPGCA